MTSSTLSIIVPICALLITIGVIVYKAGKLSNQIGQIDQKFDQKFQHLSDLLVSHKVENEKEFHLVRENIQSLRSDVKDLRDVVFDLNGNVSSNTTTLKIVHEDVKRLEEKSSA
jgi:predicted PurR-regulated permease PerM